MRVRVSLDVPSNKISRVGVIGNTPASEAGIKSSSLLFAAMRIGVMVTHTTLTLALLVRAQDPQPKSRFIVMISLLFFCMYDDYSILKKTV